MLFIKTVSLEFVLFLFVVVHCKGPPVLIGPVKPLYIVQEGKTVKLRCKFSGTNDSQDNRTLTAWQKLPEQYITSQYDKRFTTRLGRGYLKIKRVKLEDQGTYVCTAFNSFGKIQRKIRLVVQALNSSISPSGKENTKPIPSRSVLSSSAREPPIISTTKRPPRKGSRGPSKIPLIDHDPPTFRNPSNNNDRFLEYIEGVQVKLRCHARGVHPLNVTWLKNGKPLIRAGQTLLKSKGWVLNFAALSYNDAGTYTCTVRNAFGIIKRTFIIKVVVDPPQPHPQERKPMILENVLKNKTAITGEDVTFVCSAVSKSHPEFHFLKWKSLKNVSNGSDPFEFVDFTKSKFREIRKIDKQHMGNRQVYTHRLIVRNVTLADATKYTCVVGSSAGYVSKHAYLTVLSREDSVSDEPYGATERKSAMTKAPRNPPRPQSDKEIVVEEVPLAALIGVPIAVLILLIGTIVWCYFMTRKHHPRLHWKGVETSSSVPQEEMNDLSLKYYAPGKQETRNVSFNVYVDHPNNDKAIKTSPTEQQSRTHVKCASPHVTCACAIERDPPLDGLIVHNEPPRIHSNRTNHRKRHERVELESNESSGSEIKCSGV